MGIYETRILEGKNNNNSVISDWNKVFSKAAVWIDW